MPPELAPRRVASHGVELAYLEDGPGDGPLAICLHGFPDTAWTWRHLLPVLAEAGFHAVAPFLRGYAPSGLAASGYYDTGSLVADVVALHEALGGDERAVVLGHDWGAFATYGAAALAPERFRRAVALSVPPAAVLWPGMVRLAQLKRSWYVFFFQLPLAEVALAADDLALAGELWRDWSPGYDPSADLARLREALGEPARLSAALDYYRAMLDPGRQDPSLERERAAAQSPVPQPLLYLHGADDGCIGAELVADTDAVLALLGPGSRVAVVHGAGHFLHLEKPTEVNALVRAFLLA